MDRQLPVRLTLVSASPRRRDLLREAGYGFEIAPSHAAESWASKDPRKLALLNAERKVRKSDFFCTSGRLLLGADTVVATHSIMLGKPAGEESARRMLTLLSGRTHSVITGICLSGPSADGNGWDFLVSAEAVSHVTFHELSPRVISDYLATGEWEGKAGAYAIQGLARKFVSSLAGDYQNVVGLPIDLFHALFTEHFGHCILQP